MSEQTPVENPKIRLKQDTAIVLLFLILVGGFFLVYILTTARLGETNTSEQDVSLGQALTMVAQASQTALAANPGALISQPTQVPAATQITSSNFSPVSSSTPSTPITVTKTLEVVSTATRTSAPSSTTKASGQNKSPEPTFPVGNVTVRPTYTPKPTETTRPTDSPTSTPTPTATQSPGLPGLTMSAVINRLKDKGFVCTQAGNPPGPVLWMCDIQSGYDLWYHVDVYGSQNVEVTNLLASVFQTNPDEAKSVNILSFVASFPYNGANPSAASQWVAQTLPGIQSVDDVEETLIGGVRFRLYGGPQGRYLEMGEPVQQ